MTGCWPNIFPHAEAFWRSVRRLLRKDGSQPAPQESAQPGPEAVTGKTGLRVGMKSPRCRRYCLPAEDLRIWRRFLEAQIGEWEGVGWEGGGQSVNRQCWGCLDHTSELPTPGQGCWGFIPTSCHWLKTPWEEVRPHLHCWRLGREAAGWSPRDFYAKPPN